jgi:zinc transport system substrate-binding protein
LTRAAQAFAPREGGQGDLKKGKSEHISDNYYEGILVKTYKYWIGLVLCFLGVLRASTLLGAGGIPLFVSILPQKYFVEKIGGDLVDVSVMVLPGASEATYEPKPNQMVTLSRAKIYFAIGVPFEKVWLKKIATSNQQLMVVHTDKGIAKRALASHPSVSRESKEGASEGADHGSHGVKDPHIWLSPPLVEIQARTILKALQKIDPTNQAVYEANYKKFRKELREIDEEIRGMFEGRGKGAAFMVFHPSWGYFADAYGLKQIPIEVEGKAPKPAQMKALIEIAREKAISVIFVQPQFSTKRAEVIAKAIGGRIMVADPLAEDWENNLREQAMKIMTTLRETR